MKTKMVPFCDVLLQGGNVYFEFWKYDCLQELEKFQEGQIDFAIVRALTSGWDRFLPWNR